MRESTLRNEGENVDSGTADNPASLFMRYTRLLQRKYPLTKGLLVAREENGTRFVATATFSEKHTRANLSLKLPTSSSLFEKVAEGGLLYSENCCDFFSGNRFERNLLLDWDSSSFVIIPLRHDGETIGILGYSSNEPDAFATFENDLTDRVRDLLASAVASARRTAIP